MRRATRVPVVTLLLLLALPASAWGGELRVATREQAVPAGSTAFAIQPPRRFNLVGVSWQGSGSLSFQTRGLRRTWGAWRPAAPEPEDAPDGARAWRFGNPWWVGPATAIRFRVRGAVTRVRTHFVWSAADAVPLRRLSIAGSPSIIPRRAWAGSDAALRRGKPRYADALRFAVVHHTAGARSYSRAQSAAIVRGVAAYHVRSNGWDDIGYNFLVDRFGQVFEGRYGGVDRNVVGAHAQGFNDGSVGVALIGTYTATTPSPAARASLARLLAWRLDVAHVDPLSTLSHASRGNPKYGAGVPVFLRAVAGHRDTGFTSCPGDRLYAQLPAVARAAAGHGLPKLYSPTARGRVGGLVRLTARLSADLSWTVTVRDEGGGTVASGTGRGKAVDWVWDARGAAPGRYAWTMEAGPAVRPASGTLAGGSTALTLTATATPATISPDGDGRADATTVRYGLGRAAYVTAVVVDAAGAPVATLVQAALPAGNHSVTWTGDGFSDGAYTVVFTALAGNRQVAASVPVSINRTLNGLVGQPRAFSPNGDGRLDTVSLSFVLTAPADVAVEARRRDTAPAVFFAGFLPAGSHAVTWNGEALPGTRAPDGAYSVVVRATNAVGSVAQSARVTVDTRAPRLRLVSRSPMRLRVGEPGMLRITVDGALVSVPVPRAGVVRLAQGGSSVVAVAEDAAGNQSLPLRLR